MLINSSLNLYQIQKFCQIFAFNVNFYIKDCWLHFGQFIQNVPNINTFIILQTHFFCKARNFQHFLVYHFVLSFFLTFFLFFSSSHCHILSLLHASFSVFLIAFSPVHIYLSLFYGQLHN